MATIDPCHFDLVEIGRRIQARELSSLTATRTVLDRIGRLDRRLKSYATVTADLALPKLKKPTRRSHAAKYAGLCTAFPSQSRISVRRRAYRLPRAWQSAKTAGLRKTQQWSRGCVLPAQ